MKPKFLNTDDDDTLNPIAVVHNYGAGSEEDILTDPKNAGGGDDDGDDDDIDVDEDYTEDEPLPGEIANPEEQDDEDEMA